MPPRSAGGTRTANFVRCTFSIRCGWTTSTRRHRCVASACSTSVAAAAFSARRWLERGAQVTGIDLAPQTIEIAELHALESQLSIRYVREAAETHAAHSAGAYDVVTCMEMLEHVPEPESVLRALHDLVRPGGDIFVSTLNRNLKSYLMAVVGAEYVLNMLPRGTHSYERFIKPSELSRWARGARAQRRGYRRAGLRPDPTHRSPHRRRGVNYMMHLTKGH